MAGNLPLANAKHEHFAQLVSNAENPTRAYVLAGYSGKGAKQSAARLMTNADVCDRIAYLRQQKEQEHRAAVQGVIAEAAIDKKWVLDRLTKIVDMGMAAEAVLDNEGNPIGEYKANLAGANKALELIGKELGMFVDRKEVRTGPLDNLPPDDAKALIEAIDAIQRARTAGPAAGSAASPAQPS